MKKSYLFITVLLLSIGVTTVSCKKKGCTDSTATNYDSKAKKDDGSCVYPKAPQTTSIDSPEQVNYDKDGTSVSFTVGSVNGSDKSIGDTTTATWSAGFYDDPNSRVILDVSKGIKTYVTGTMTDQIYSAYFSPGSYSYAASGGSGIKIYLGDTTTGYYRSELGDQTGSAFQIVDKKDEYYGGQLYVKVYATFNCKLYNENNLSDVITITNGEFVNHFVDL